MAWELTSHAKLAGAGYLFVREVNCRRCGEPVLLYRTAGDRAIALDRKSFEPHAARCKPARAQKQKTVQQRELF
ncbi:MAG TPA: hypothetical protein VNU44_14440 [Bryobacteraceae bacterium]|jgi:hypothetical protein|nr:hypothetical protein [Bryobacteraceae bacterium]